MKATVTRYELGKFFVIITTAPTTTVSSTFYQMSQLSISSCPLHIINFHFQLSIASLHIHLPTTINSISISSYPLHLFIFTYFLLSHLSPVLPNVTSTLALLLLLCVMLLPHSDTIIIIAPLIIIQFTSTRRLLQLVLLWCGRTVSISTSNIDSW